MRLFEETRAAFGTISTIFPHRPMPAFQLTRRPTKMTLDQWAHPVIDRQHPMTGPVPLLPRGHRELPPPRHDAGRPARRWGKIVSISSVPKFHPLGRAGELTAFEGRHHS